MQQESTYNFALPAFNFTYLLTDDLQLRLGAAKTMARPAVDKLAPTNTTEGISWGDFTQVFGGNAELKPYSARQVDASLEWYYSKDSALTFAVYQKNIKNAVKWLRKNQQDNGLFGTNASHDFIYGHAIAAYAMCEAYGLSDHRPIRAAVQKGIDYIENARNPYAAWRYQPRDNDNDSSVTTWCVLALASADFFGLRVDKNAFKTVAAWFDSVTGPDGRTGYTKVGDPSSRLPGGDHKSRFPPEREHAPVRCLEHGGVGVQEGEELAAQRP